MHDESKHWDIVAIKSNAVRWRIFEHECCQIHFGTVGNYRPEDSTVSNVIEASPKVIYWKLHTESTPSSLLDKSIRIAKQVGYVKHINDPRGWINCHAKEKAFAVWQKNDIPCPRWFEFLNEQDFFRKCSFTYPMLIRLNNSTSGQFSYLCRNEVQVRQAIRHLEKNKNYRHDGINNTGVGRKFIGVQFIDTVRSENVCMSFRIIVAGSKVVAGYARLGRASDWIAITNRFEDWMKEVFVKYQKVCQKFCEDNEKLLVKSVKTLGLNFQGVDVILDKNDNPYFIEVQPGFSVGVANVRAWKPPFYNPSRPEALVRFLIKEEKRLRAEIPFYYNCWLDKYAMFHSAFKALKEDMERY